MRENIPDYTVVVPSNRETLHTPAGVPDEMEVMIRRDDGINTARNAGVRAAKHQWVVLTDDDIDFPRDMVESTLREMRKEDLAGLHDFEPLRWVIGRLMIFHKDLWEAVGGFDESREHGGDTDFAIRAEKLGGRILRLNRESVRHYDVDTGDGMRLFGHVKWTLRLLLEHPLVFSPVVARLVARKFERVF